MAGNAHWELRNQHANLHRCKRPAIGTNPQRLVQHGIIGAGRPVFTGISS